MFRRWLIRSLFMVPILLGLVGWEWSAGHSGEVWYQHDDLRVGGATGWGVLGVGTIDSRSGMFGAEPDGWICKVSPMAEIRFLLPNNSNVILGFGYGSMPSSHQVEVPYWFLIVIFSVVLFFVWRKTRPKPQGGAFPVEVTGC